MIRGLSLGWMAVLFLLPAARTHGADTGLGSPDSPVKFGFTKAMFVDLNEADTRAAVKSYAMLLATNNDLAVSDAPGVLEDPNAVKEAFANGSADIVSLTSLEFLQLPDGSAHSRIVCASQGGTFTEKYVLLVNNNSGFQTISDLKNKRLLVYSSLRGALSPLWLDVLLATNGQKEASQFFSSITPVNKPSRTVLPVFFHQADGCIVTQNGFNVMCEMNPQIARDLKIIAISPEVIPSVTCFRAGISPQNVERLINAVVDAQHTVSGRQVLTIFQCDRISEINAKQLDSIRALLATQARLRGDTQPLDNLIELSKPAKHP